MTDQEIKEAADEYGTINSRVSSTSPMSRFRRDKVINAFTAGAKWAEKEAYNQALEDVIRTIKVEPEKVYIHLGKIYEELKKLRK